MWKANKFVNILLWIVALISVAVCIYVFIICGKYDIVNERTELLGVLDPMFYWAYILVAVTSLLALLLPVPQVIENPKSAIGIVVGIVGFLLVVGLSFAFAVGDQLPFTPGHEPVSEGTIKFADVNIIAIYIMLGSAILATVGTSIWNIIKLR